jgi:hypothetical protein
MPDEHRSRLAAAWRDIVSLRTSMHEALLQNAPSLSIPAPDAGDGIAVFSIMFTTGARKVSRKFRTDNQLILVAMAAVASLRAVGVPAVDIVCWPDSVCDSVAAKIDGGVPIAYDEGADLGSRGNWVLRTELLKYVRARAAVEYPCRDVRREHPAKAEPEKRISALTPPFLCDEHTGFSTSNAPQHSASSTSSSTSSFCDTRRVSPRWAPCRPSVRRVRRAMRR